MLPDNHIREGLSRAYLMSVASRAGLLIDLKRDFDLGIDGTFHGVKVRTKPNGGRRYVESGFKIDFQIKASHNCIIKGDEIIFDLEAKNYTDLIDTAVGTPRILVLLRLPDDQTKWFTQTSQRLILRHCVYWCSLYGHKSTANDKTVRIRIPTSQRLTVKALRKLMKRVQSSGKI